MPNPQSEAERLVALEAGMHDMRRDIGEIRGNVSIMRSEIRDDIAKMRDDLAKRPSWAVTTILSILLAACTGLGSALVVVVSTT